MKSDIYSRKYIKKQLFTQDMANDSMWVKSAIFSRKHNKRTDNLPIWVKYAIFSRKHNKTDD